MPREFAAVIHACLFDFLKTALKLSTEGKLNFSDFSKYILLKIE